MSTSSTSNASLYGDINPQPTYQGGPTNLASTFGGVPGQLNIPPSILQELQGSVGGYGNLMGGATSGIQSQLSGQLSPSTMMNIGNYAASRGVAMGEPNSPLSNEIGMATTGNTTESLIGQGIGNYNTLTGTLSQDMINPNLTGQIEEQNAVDAAAPNPQQASWYEQALATGLMRTSPAGSSGSGFSTAMGDISSVLGLVGMGGGKGGGGSSIGGGGGSGIGAILGML